MEDESKNTEAADQGEGQGEGTGAAGEGQGDGGTGEGEAGDGGTGAENTENAGDGVNEGDGSADNDPTVEKLETELGVVQDQVEELNEIVRKKDVHITNLKAQIKNLKAGGASDSGGKMQRH